ncbi:Os01g0114600 [Oryza sativa Japonica Group]|uniref:Os01g0114600 protein n=1 Tax=Oryza sativa subsp. japonica TaxID=39947 RepID=A0A0P0UXQ1_ORYSJ|nr:Os01g0114600 [Oryza sativa Japonica Group]
MAVAGAFRRSTSTALQALTALSVLAALLQVEGQMYGPEEAAQTAQCPPFSWGHLKNVSPPFRRHGDPPDCGYKSHELVCSDTKATIRINNATYYVTRIIHWSLFVVVDTDLLNSHNSSCPLPRRQHQPPHERISMAPTSDGVQVIELAPFTNRWAAFVNCSKEITRNVRYKPVACLSTSHSFVYVLTGSESETVYVESLEPSCGYLGMTPLDDRGASINASLSYADVLKYMRKGFAIGISSSSGTYHFDFRACLAESVSIFRQTMVPSSDIYIKNRLLAILLAYGPFWQCIMAPVKLPRVAYEFAIYGTGPAMSILTWIAVLCRFLLAPLVVLTFLSHKYWKARITIDAVEKFLRMQEMLSPMRYGYTDIIAITSHFRDRLGQGSYGTVYKGVLLPGNIHVAVKMLNGNSNCNGEEFISEVSTIGRIHHVNVVRLVGFCSEEMRRALVYEYMPRGSLDKYIFSSDKSFSRDKLNEIALGIARGINYLHQGCDLQILHFDIKPHNILLDKNFVPKVADFGLARLYPRDKSFVPVSAARGTVGYIAPEMISRSFGVISSKSDVYSFGMLLLEMAGGRRNADPNAENSSQAYYPSRVYRQLTRQETGEITAAADMHELEKKLCIVGLWCIQMRSCDRPMMSEVIEMLEGGVDCLQIPPRPFFCDDDYIPAMESLYLSSELELAAISEEKDEESITELN